MHINEDIELYNYPTRTPLPNLRSAHDALYHEKSVLLQHRMMLWQYGSVEVLLECKFPA